MEKLPELTSIDIHLENFSEEKVIEFIKNFNKLLKKIDPENEKYEIILVLAGNMNTPEFKPMMTIAASNRVLSEDLIEPLIKRIENILKAIGVEIENGISESSDVIKVD